MNSRRAFLMKLGAGLIGSLIIRPSIPEYTWNTTRIDFYMEGIPYHINDGTTGIYLAYPRHTGFIDNIQIPEGY